MLLKSVAPRRRRKEEEKGKRHELTIPIGLLAYPRPPSITPSEFTKEHRRGKGRKRERGGR